MNKLFNEYGMKARVFPAVLCSIPFLIIKFILIDKYIPTASEKVLTFTLIDVPIWLVLVYFLTQINRFVSKSFFENKNDFPTQRMLMPSGKGMSQNMRSKIAERVEAEFGLPLPNLQDENADIVDTNTRIKEIVGMIINKVGRGKLLLQHNLEYGFVRNLMGGSVVASIVALADIAIFKWILPNHTALVISIILFVCYLVPIVFSRPALKSYSQEYADKLFREYLGMA